MRVTGSFEWGKKQNSRFTTLLEKKTEPGSTGLASYKQEPRGPLHPPPTPPVLTKSLQP